MGSAKQELVSYNPTTGRVIWSGIRWDEQTVARAVKQARVSQRKWEELGLDARKTIVQKFGDMVRENLEEASRIISEENGKPLWEARTEVQALVDKVQASFDAYDDRSTPKQEEVPGKVLATRFRAHGIMAVIGPYNFPMHMPNCHIMPALLAGNSVIFKPSRRTPKSAEYYASLWQKAGLPDKVLQVSWGDGTMGDLLISQPEIDGVLFVGSHEVGIGIEKKLAGIPGKIRALEMGGNNPLVVWDYEDVRSAVYMTIQSAYITSGQRCSAARRLIVNRAIASDFLPLLEAAIKSIVVGDPLSMNPEPFMGPLIDQRAVRPFLSDYEKLVSQGAKILVPCEQIAEFGENFIRPGLLDTTDLVVEDKEIFGPLLRLTLVDSMEEAIDEANRTQYGLCAGIFTQSQENYDLFFGSVKAGVINWNLPITGAPVSIAFGGMGASGNHRPTGYLAADYCTYACASSESNTLSLPEQLPPGLKL